MINDLGNNSVVLTPVREQVAVILKRKIINGEILPGETINLRKTASELGVSSMPVREALQILNNQGFVELKANKPAVVVGMSESHVRDFCETLLILEVNVAGLAAERNTDVSELEAILLKETECLKTNNLDLMEDLNNSFHCVIRNLSQNDYLVKIIDNLWATSARNVTSLSKGLYETNHKDHKKIYTAIKSHNVEAAREAMRSHMMRVTRHGSIKSK